SLLTRCTSSSEKYCRMSAAGSSPSMINNMAALRRAGRVSTSDVVVLRIKSGFLLADPGAQNLGGHLGFLLDLVAEVFGQHLGGFSDHGGHIQVVEGVGLQLQ